MSRVGFVVHPGRSGAAEVLADLAAGLSAEGVEHERLPDEVPDGWEPGAALDLVVSIGGDGTFLRAARIAAQIRAPVLGVKVGRMGFLTEVEPPGALGTATAVLAGEARIESRMALTARIVLPDGSTEPVAAQWALNEVIVEKTARHRLLRLGMRVDGVDVTTFSADGVIVSTPTGSTAYSFSARGPIVAPDLALMVATPIAAHMVFDRSFVLSPSASVVLEVVGEEPGVLSADGRESLEVPVGGQVHITASDRPCLFVRDPAGEGFYARVRDKFGLPGDRA